MRHSSNFKDITGQKFGRLTAIKYVGRNKNKYALWECQCDCGNVVVVIGRNLRTGITKSCGCYNLDMIVERNKVIHKTHGATKTRLFRIWSGIKTRCYNTNSEEYKTYGGRGIKMCEEWLSSFQTFKEWALSNGYDDTLSIDRIDYNGNYSPENCRWLTAKGQQRNKRSNKVISYNGESHCLSEWGDILGISDDVLLKRLNSKNYTLERAFSEPLNSHDHFNDIIVYNGESKTLTEWANYLSLPYNVLRSRLFSQNWTVERAFTTKYISKRRTKL